MNNIRNDMLNILKSVQLALCLACMLGGAITGYPQTTNADYAVPNPEIIGEELKLFGIETYIGSGNGTMPDQIVMDLESGKVIGLVAIYPKSANLQSLKAALSKMLTEESVAYVKDDVVIWKNHKKGYSIMLGMDDGRVEIVMHRFFKMNSTHVP